MISSRELADGHIISTPWLSWSISRAVHIQCQVSDAPKLEGGSLKCTICIRLAIQAVYFRSPFFLCAAFFSNAMCSLNVKLISLGCEFDAADSFAIAKLASSTRRKMEEINVFDRIVYAMIKYGKSIPRDDWRQFSFGFYLRSFA